ncbi:MAG: microcin C transport system permease protein, partial [bacterium]
MKSYLIRRVLLIIPTVIGITLLTFVITRFVPGGPIEQIMMQNQFQQSQSGGSSSSGSLSSRQGLSDEDLQYLRKFYGFDQPILVAYWEWLKKIAIFDLGESYRYNEPVLDLLKSR